jgi:hypothetical protein
MVIFKEEIIMMANNEKIKMFETKKQFIDGLSDVFNTNSNCSSVTGITYEVFTKEFNGKPIFYEWVIVHFDGGGFSARNVNGNSHTANFREIAKLIDGGYYIENSDYLDFPNIGFTKVDL